MPFVCPRPLGGFASELGSLTERQRAIEAARTNATVAVSYAPQVTVSNVYPTFTTPTGWPSLTVDVQSTSGLMLFFGVQISPKVPVNGSDVIYMNCSMDGTLIEEIVGASGQTGFPVGGSTIALNAITLVPDGISVMTLPMGAHTFTLSVALGTATTHALLDTYMAAWLF